MSIESATYISQLNASYPAAGDPKSEGDDHMRLIKAALLATFPNLTATAVNATCVEINALVGATTTGATIKVVTQATTDSSTLAASTAIVDAKITAAGLTSALPGQTGNSGKFVKTNGTTASWEYVALPWVRKTSAYTAVVGDRIKASTTGGAWSLTLPASPSNGDSVEVQDVDGTFHTANLTVLPNGAKVMGYTTSFVIDTRYFHPVFVYDSTLGDWRI